MMLNSPQGGFQKKIKFQGKIFKIVIFVARNF